MSDSDSVENSEPKTEKEPVEQKPTEQESVEKEPKQSEPDDSDSMFNFTQENMKISSSMSQKSQIKTVAKESKKKKISEDDDDFDIDDI